MIIDGRKIAADILSQLQKQLEGFSFRPILCDLLVGDDPASLSYVKIKGRKAESIDMEFQLKQMPAESTTEQIIAALHEIQRQEHLCGLIVQLPLPSHVDRQAVLNSIDPRVDVDVLNSERNNLVPPTAAAILNILETLPLDLSSQKFLVVGQGDLVGKPVTALLRERGYSVTTADSQTSNLSELTRSADVIISGTGQVVLITGDMVKAGSVVIDAGTSESGGSISGDVDFDSVQGVAGYISPVPGGVGPVTVAKLLENVIAVASQGSPLPSEKL